MVVRQIVLMDVLEIVTTDAEPIVQVNVAVNVIQHVLVVRAIVMADVKILAQLAHLVVVVVVVVVGLHAVKVVLIAAVNVVVVAMLIVKVFATIHVLLQQIPDRINYNVLYHIEFALYQNLKYTQTLNDDIHIASRQSVEMCR